MVLSVNIVYLYMSVLYILSLVYTIRLTIFFAGMGSAPFTKAQLNSFASPFLAYYVIVGKGKNDQEASPVIYVDNI